MDLTRTLLPALAAALALAAPSLAYTSGGTFVAKIGGETLVDDGVAVCDGFTGDGAGGGCLPFPLRDAGAAGRASFIGVKDDVARDVAFQVCIDNNGDGICGGPQLDPACPDQLFFSHADSGAFYNPLGPLPPRALPGCDQAFPGYVVLLCEGAHQTAGLPHVHPVTRGTIFPASYGSGFGNFCGGGGSGGQGVSASAKAYRIE